MIKKMSPLPAPLEATEILTLSPKRKEWAKGVKNQRTNCSRH